MSNVVTTSSALEGDQVHVRGFVTSFAKCWVHFVAYMQNPDNTYKGFIKACKEDAAQQGIEIQLPAPRTFENRTAKLKQAGEIPPRTQSDNPEAVKKRKQREKGTNPQIGEMSPSPEPAPIVQAQAPQQELNTIEFSSAIQPMRELQPGEKTSDLYRILTQKISDLEETFQNKQLDFTEEEWCSLHAQIWSIERKLQVKVDIVAASQRDRDAGCWDAASKRSA